MNKLLQALTLRVTNPAQFRIEGENLVPVNELARDALGELFKARAVIDTPESRKSILRLTNSKTYGHCGALIVS